MTQKLKTRPLLQTMERKRHKKMTLKYENVMTSDLNGRIIVWHTMYVFKETVK